MFPRTRPRLLLRCGSALPTLHSLLTALPLSRERRTSLKDEPLQLRRQHFRGLPTGARRCRRRRLPAPAHSMAAAAAPTPGEAGAALRADLALLDASTKEAAALLDLASWQVAPCLLTTVLMCRCAAYCAGGSCGHGRHAGRCTLPFAWPHLLLQLSELDRGVAPMTRKTSPLLRARANIGAAKARSEEVLEHLDASRKVGGRGRGSSGLLCSAAAPSMPGANPATGWDLMSGGMSMWRWNHRPSAAGVWAGVHANPAAPACLRPTRPPVRCKA